MHNQSLIHFINIYPVFSYLNKKLESEFSRLSLWYFVSFIFGITFYFSLSFEPSVICIVIFFITAIILLVISIIRKKILLVFLSSILVAFVFGVIISKHRMMNTNSEAIELPIITIVTGKIESIKPTIKGISVILKNIKGKDIDKLQKVKISIPEKYKTKVSINDIIKLRVKLHPPQTMVLPNSYDFGMYSYFGQIGATGYAMSKLVVISSSNNQKKDHYIFSVRTSIYNRLITLMGKKAGNFASAILLGETQGIDKSILKNMRQAGISHILCVSGLHLSLVAMLFFITTRFILNLSDYIAFNFNIKLISGISALISSYIYLLLTGAPVAATRAFIMSSIFIAAIIIERQPLPIRSISIASFIILSLNPEYVFHPSFQLSFIAVLSLVVGYEFYQKNKWILGESKGIFASIKFYVASNVYSSFLASIVTAPVVINQFYTFSTYSIFANLIAVPIMSFFLMPLSLIGIILMPFGVDKFIFLTVKFFINITIDLANYFCELPGSVWYFGYITQLSLILFLLGFFWLCIWQTKWRFYGILVMVISCVLMANSPKPDLIYDPILKVVGVKNKQNKLEIYGDKIPEFNKIYWANWFGEKEIKSYPLDTSEFMTNNGHKLLIDYDNATIKDGKAMLQGNKTKGTVLVFCDKSLCHLKFNKNNRIIKHFKF